MSHSKKRIGLLEEYEIWKNTEETDQTKYDNLWKRLVYEKNQRDIQTAKKKSKVQKHPPQTQPQSFFMDNIYLRNQILKLDNLETQIRIQTLQEMKEQQQQTSPTEKRHIRIKIIVERIDK